MSSPFERLLVVLDYDGTITEDDCNEIVLTQAVGDAWLPSERALHRGEITHTEAFRQQIALLHWPRRHIMAASVAAARLRPGFSQFLCQLIDGGARVTVVSVGFQQAIEAVWRREELPPVDVYASELLGDERGYQVGFHPLTTDCPRCDKCKAGVMRTLRQPGDVVVVFGDGDGDLCLAREADMVFARARLATLCDQEDIPYAPFNSYATVISALKRGLCGTLAAAGGTA